MRNVLIPAMATFIATSSFAAAESEEKTTGVVKRYDSHAMTLTLDNGPTFHLATSFRDPGIKTGETVKVSWLYSMGSQVAARVEIVG